MITRAVLTGPASPADIAHRFTGADAKRALTVPGYRGVPVTELAEALIDLGVSVELISAAPEVDERVSFEGTHLRMVVVPLRERARARALDFFAEERRFLSRELAATEARLIHAHWTYEFAWAAQTTNRAVVVTAHDAPLTVLNELRDAYRGIRALMAYRVRLRVRHLTAVSPYLATQWRRQMQYRRPITVVPNIARRLTTSAHPGLGAPLIIDVANSGPLKNVSTLLRAFNLLREDGVEARLMLVGPGLDAADEVARRARAAGLGKDVCFAGTLDRDALSQSLARASLFVHPSFEECCPMSVLEAMAAGVPVVAGRASGGTPWVLGDGEAGVLVDIRDPDAIRVAIAGLLNDPSRARAIAERARAEVDRRFSSAAVAERYLDVYASASQDGSRTTVPRGAVA